MRRLTTAAAIAVFGIGTAAVAQQAGDIQEQGVVRAGAGPAMPSPAAYFVGQVSARRLVEPQAPGRTSVGLVTFQPGAHTNWHTHPGGQVLYVTDGCGWTQREGGPVIRVCNGDTVYVPAGVKHWHGATATTSMTHLSITEWVNGKNVEWMEPVTDEQYRADAVK